MNKLYHVSLFFSCLLVASFAIADEEKFDTMRCNGKLISPGDSLAAVVENCGEPIDRRNWGNQYETQKHLIFKALGESGCYYTFFRDDQIVASHYRGYQGCN